MKNDRLTLSNGKKRTEELYYDTSILSQSGRFLKIDKNVVAAEAQGPDGKTRIIDLQ